MAEINQSNDFDDAEFKSAVKRACAGIRAGDALRQRAVAQAARAAQIDAADSASDGTRLGSIKLSMQPPVASRPSVRFTWRSPALRVAAGLLIAFIGAYFVLMARTAAASVPQAVLESM